ncbi:MAG: hypothetical protein R3B48_14175 [Kofleriaceae bacterium]
MSGSGSDDDDELSRREIERGFMSVNNRVQDQTVQLQRLAAHVYTLTELLVNDAVVSLEELEQRRSATYEQMRAEHPLRWLTAKVHHLESDKYDPKQEVLIDCASRLSLCRAACCRMTFYLSNQDLEEGVIRWDLARPYRVKQRADGYCVHCAPEERTCAVWSARPQPCRAYDCRSDKRIWQDFEARIANPALAQEATALGDARDTDERTPR